jgi:hypothetical protein
MHDGASLLSDARHSFAPFVAPYHTLAESTTDAGSGEDWGAGSLVG